MIESKAVLDAVAEVIKAERKLTTDQIRDVIADEKTALLDLIAEVQKEPGPQGEKGAAGEAPSLDDVVKAVTETEGFWDRVKGAPAPAVAPDDVARSLREDDAFVETITGKDADPADVVKMIFGDEDLIKRITGPGGEDGKDGPAPDYDEILERVKSDPVLMEHMKPRDGKDGKDADVADVVKMIFTDEELVEKISGRKGDKGDPGDPADPDEVADLLFAKKEFVDKLTPRDPIDIHAKAWAPGVTREGVTVQHHLGRYYTAKCDTVQEPGDGEDWERVGTSGFRWCGVKKKSAEYVDGDIYIEDGTAFIFHKGKGQMLARRGRDGKPGADGNPGRPGADAPQVIGALFDDTELKFMMDNGEELVADLKGFEQTISDSLALQLKEISWFDRLRDEAQERGDTLITRFRNVWLPTVNDYVPGDVVKYMKKLYLCTEATSGNDVGAVGIDGEKWVVLSEGGGGAGGGGAGAGVNPPAVGSHFQVYTWQPTVSNPVSGGTWMDGRTLMSVVAQPQDLIDPTILPENQLVQGKLVYVRSEGVLYEHIADTATRQGTMDDWRPLVSGVTYKARAGDLPTAAVNGQLFIVRMDMAGEPLNRLVTWRDQGNIDAATVLTGSMPITDGSSETLTVTFPSGQTTAPENDQFYIELAFSDGTVVTRTIQIAAGDTPDGVAAKIHAALGQGVPQLTPTVAGNVVTLAPAAGFDISSFFTTASPTAGARGGWVFVNRENWVKSLRADPDQISDQQPGDLQITTEANGKELKVYEGGAWQTVFSEEDVKAWIAAGSQFQGTVEEAGHSTAGAIELGGLPAQTALSVGEKAHYWIWVGTSGHTIAANSIGGAASAIDGAALSVGDWIIVAETGANTGVFQYRVIPGDLMSRTVARQMFSMQPWVAGAWPQDSVVVYQGDVYRAPQAITAQDPAPDDPASAWVKVNISGGLKVANDDGQLPPTAPAGQVWIILSSAQYGGQALVAYDGGSRQWEQLGGGGIPLDFAASTEIIGVGTPVGSVISYAGQDVPDGWLLCDGGSFRQQDYPELYVVLGNRTTTPDLRDHFIMGGVQSTPFQHRSQSTARPHNAFRTSEDGNHRHAANSNMKWHGLNDGNGSNNLEWGSGTRPPSADEWTAEAGHHHHFITQGGDTYTRPNHVIMKYILKAIDRTVRLR